MKLEIIEITPDSLVEYARVPSSLLVRSVLQVELIQGGLGGMHLEEVPVDPYIKDHEPHGESPLDWPRRFDVHEWGFFLARGGDETAAAAAVAVDSTGVFSLESRPDRCVLWDIRLHPHHRGAGIPLFRYAGNWSRTRGFRQMRVDPACRFYQRMGCELGEIRRFGYAGVPEVAHEVMLNWYYRL